MVPIKTPSRPASCYDLFVKKEFVKKFFIPTLVVAVVLSFMIFDEFSKKDTTGSQGQAGKTILLSIGQANIKAFVADTGPLRQRGLGGRDGISNDEAMLFIFDNVALHGIWMKDMRFPIDIFWLAPANFTEEKSLGIDEVILKVVDIRQNVSPATFPEVFTPISPAKYVLETVAGFAEKNKVKIGDEISF